MLSFERIQPQPAEQVAPQERFKQPQTSEGVLLSMIHASEESRHKALEANDKEAARALADLMRHEDALAGKFYAQSLHSEMASEGITQRVEEELDELMEAESAPENHG